MKCVGLRLVLLSLLLVSTFAVAEETVEHETVVVTASKLDADHINTEHTSSHTTVIRSSEFGHEFSNVADVLSDQSGVQIRQVGGIGSYSTVSIRGSSAAQVNVFLDGMLLNDAHGGIVDLGNIQLSSIERIEIYRGNTPAQLGVSSIGGAINLVSKKGAAKPYHTVRAGYGSFKSHLGALTSAFHSGDTNYLVNAEYVSSDNDYEFLNDRQTPNNPFDDEVQRRQNAQYEQGAIHLSAVTDISKSLDANNVVRYSKSSKGVPTARNAKDNSATYDVETLSIQSKLNHELSTRLKASYQIYGSLLKGEYDDTENKVGLSANLEKSESSNIGVKTDWALSSGNHLFNIAALLRFEKYENEDLIQNTSTDASRMQTSLIAQDEWLNYAGTLQLTGKIGLRYLQDDQDIPKSVSNTESYYAAYSGLRYTFFPSLALTASLSHEVRPPKLSELFGDTGSLLGNDELVEEYATNAELGLQFLQGNSNLNSSLFYRSLKDAIVVIFDSRGIGRAENAASAQIYGLEVDGSILLTEFWKAGLRATLQSSEDTSDIPAFKGNSLAGVYESAATISNEFSVFDYKLNLEYQRQDGGYYDRSASAEMPTNEQINVSIERRLGQHNARLSLENITDERIEDFNRYPGPGRRAFLTYSYTFN